MNLEKKGKIMESNQRVSVKLRRKSAAVFAALALGVSASAGVASVARADAASDYQSALTTYKAAMAQWKIDQAKAVADFKAALMTWQDQNKGNQAAKKKANEDFAASIAAARAIFQKAVADATAAHNAALAAVPTAAPKPVLNFTEVRPTPPAKPAKVDKGAAPGVTVTPSATPTAAK
jgi:hypothetical protein